MLVWFGKGLLGGVAKVGQAFQRLSETRTSHSDYPRQLYNINERVLLAKNIDNDTLAVSLEQAGIDFLKSRNLSTNHNDAALSRKDGDLVYCAGDPGCVYYMPLFSNITLAQYKNLFESYHHQTNSEKGFVGVRAMGLDKRSMGLDKHSMGLDKHSMGLDKFSLKQDAFSLGTNIGERGAPVGSVTKNSSLTGNESQVLHELFANKYPHTKAGLCTCTRRLPHGYLTVQHKNGKSYTYATLQCFGCKKGFQVPLRKLKK